MSFDEAVRIVTVALQPPGSLGLEDLLRINEACALLAVEYLRVKERIMPA